MKENTQKNVVSTQGLQSKQKTDEVPNLIQQLREQHGNSVTYIRLYIQEDKYWFYPSGTSQLKPIHPQSPILISLPINQVIYSTINQMLIESKFIYSNSKIMNSIMDSGKEIQQRHVKKHLSWVGFLNRPEFSMINKAYESLSENDQAVLEWSILAISNLILKLGINVSKLSCILTQRKRTTKFLSIPTLSILFLQNLMYTMLSNKQIDSDDEGKSQYIRQLPKVTYIKLSQFINKHELLLMEIGEYVFFTSQAIKAKKVKNTQYLQFYQHEQKNGFKGYQKITDYKHIHSINMTQIIGNKSPYGFELLLMFRTIYFPIISQFNPDAIIFVEDYDNTKEAINPQVRALLLAQLMQKVTGNVFVMREVGFMWEEEKLIGSVDVRELLRKKQAENDIKEMENDRGVENVMKNQMEEQSNKKIIIPQLSNMTIQQAYQFLDELAYEIPKITKRKQQQLDIQQDKIFTSQIKHSQITANQTKNSQNTSNQTKSSQITSNQIMKLQITQQAKKSQTNSQKNRSNRQKIQSVLRSDLAYIALALIQRNSFDEISTQSHHYQYLPDFIKKLINQIDFLLGSIQKSTDLHKSLNLSKADLTSMLENMKLQTYNLFKNYQNEVYLVCYKKSFQLIVLFEENKSKQSKFLKYYNQDYLHVFYGPNQEILVFLIRFQPNQIQQKVIPQNASKFRQLTHCLRFRKTNQKNLENYYFQSVFHDEHIVQGSTIRNPTFLVTDKYIYRAFGIQKNLQKLQKVGKSQIIRAEYRKLLRPLNKKNKKQSLTQQQSLTQLEYLKQPKKVLEWRRFSECSPIYQKTEIPLMQKEYGWAVYNQSSESAIFAGGYTPHVQSRVNKYMHLLWQKEQKINQMGKTSAQIFQGAKFPKARIPLFPFIYGIVFPQQKSCIILNTNGFFQCFTNSNKLFLTQLRTSSDQKHGIVWQRKLFTSHESEEEWLRVVATKQFIIHMIVKSYRLVNCYQNTCVLQTLDDGVVILRLVQVKATKSYEIHVQRKQNKQNDLGLPFQQQSIGLGPSQTTSQIQGQKGNSQQKEDKFAVLEFKTHDI